MTLCRKPIALLGFFLVLSALFFVSPTHAGDVPELKKLVHGLQWSPGRNSPDLKPPLVKKTAVPSIRAKGVKTFGVAYEITMEEKAPRYPLLISFPLPAGAMAEVDRIVFVKLSGGKEELLFPSTVDKESMRATLLVRSFSTIVVGTMESRYQQIVIEGVVMMTEEAEEEPAGIFFDMTSRETSSGESANFVYETNGLEKFYFKQLFPSTLFGSYVFHRIVGFSHNFLFAGDPRVTPPVIIDGSKSTVGVSLNVIPVTTRMEGRVVDRDGNPLEGVRIELSGPYNITYRTRSREGGRYFKDYIGMTDPRISMTESMACTLTNPEDKDCPPVKLTLKLTAGKTYREDLVYHPQGEIRGYIRDKWRNELEGATIEVRTSRGETITREVSSPYLIEYVPVGEATVTVTCAAGVHKQTKTVDVACKIPGISEDFTNFELDCAGTIRGLVRDRFGNELKQVSIKVRPSQNETITRRVDSPFEISDIPVGEATITATCAAGVHQQTQTVDISCDAPGSKGGDIEYELDCCGEIRGHVRDKDGADLKGATIQVKPAGGKTITREVSGTYHITNIPVGEAVVTATCPDGQGRESIKVRINCKAPDSAVPDTDFTLDCESGMTFRIRNTGNLESKGYLYNITGSTNAEFTLYLPKGESEAEVEATYPVQYVLEANAVGPARIVSISPSSFTLDTRIRWRVEKHEKNNGVTEYLFSGEAVHHDTQDIVVVYDSGSGLDPITNLDFTGVSAPADQMLDPMSFVVRQGADGHEFPFARRRDRSDSMPQGVIGTQGNTRNRYRNEIRIDLAGESRD